MSKPLTIDELKALEVGDWVWLVDIGEQITTQEYRAVKYKDSDGLYLEGICFSGYRPYPSLGKAWLAYKNKEMAEAKGEIVNLYQTAFELILQDVYTTRLQADTMSCSSCPFMEALFNECQNQGLYENCKKRWEDYYLSQAESRLAELKGEKA